MENSSDKPNSGPAVLTDGNGTQLRITKLGIWALSTLAVIGIGLFSWQLVEIVHIGHEVAGLNARWPVSEQAATSERLRSLESRLEVLTERVERLQAAQSEAAGLEKAFRNEARSEHARIQGELNKVEHYLQGAPP